MGIRGVCYLAVRRQQAVTTVARTKKEIYAEMEKLFGKVPSFYKAIPEPELEHEWEIHKTLQFGETKIPNKYKELIGLAAAAVKGCQYCTLFHTEAAKLSGATDEEIHEAARMAKLTAGWSSYLYAAQIDYAQFKKEAAEMIAYVKKHPPR